MSERQKPWPSGPWEYIGNSWQHTTIYAAGRVPLARIDLEDWGVTEDNQDELEKKQEDLARLIVAAPELVDRLESSNRYLIAERDSFYDSITDSEGNITDPDDGFGLQELDHLIDANRALLARIYGDTPESNNG